MFITKKRYDALLSTIVELKNGITARDQYIECLKRDISSLKSKNDFDFMISMFRGGNSHANPYDIDFPNTSRKGGKTDNTGIDTLGDIFEL